MRLRLHEILAWVKKVQIPDLLAALRRVLQRRSVQDRLGGWGITAALLVGMYVLAAFKDVSPTRYATRILTFSAASIPAAPPASTSTPATSTRAPESRSEPMPTRERIGLAPAPALSADPSAPDLSSRTPEAGATLRNLPAPRLSADRSESRTRSSTTAPQQRRRLPLPGRPALPSARGELEQRELGLPIRVPEREVPVERQEIEAVEVRVFDETTLTQGDSRTREIIQWVKENPAPLPDVIRRHMDHLDGDHTAAATYLLDGREVEIFLLLRGGYSQLHVVMVDGDASYLFYDRGLQKEASRFRVGAVTRSGGQIARIVSQEREITSSESQQFYRAFVEWWETKEGSK